MGVVHIHALFQLAWVVVAPEQVQPVGDMPGELGCGLWSSRLKRHWLHGLATTGSPLIRALHAGRRGRFHAEFVKKCSFGDV